MKEITQGQFASIKKKKDHKPIFDIEDRDRDASVKGYTIKIRGKYYTFTDDEWQKTFDDLDEAMEKICTNK